MPFTGAFLMQALLVVGVLRMHATDRRAWRIAGALFDAGVVLFSGSLYALAISGVRMLGAVTPFGGLAFIAAWVRRRSWMLRICDALQELRMLLQFLNFAFSFWSRPMSLLLRTDTSF